MADMASNASTVDTGSEETQPIEDVILNGDSVGGPHKPEVVVVNYNSQTVHTMNESLNNEKECADMDTNERPDNTDQPYKGNEMDSTLKGLLVAIKALGTKIDRMDKTNDKILNTLINMVKTDGTESRKATPEQVRVSPNVTSLPFDDLFNNKNHRVGMSNNTARSDENSVETSLNKLKNIETIYIYGDDDVTNKTTTPLGKGTGTYMRKEGPKKTATYYKHDVSSDMSSLEEVDTNLDESNHEKPFMSNYRRGIQSNVSQMVPSKSTLTTRRLTYTPATGGRCLKKLKTEFPTAMGVAQKTSTSKGYSSKDVAYKGKAVNAHKGNASSTLKHIPCVFKPTVDMRLTELEVKVCVYIFNPKLDPSGKDLLFVVGNNIGKRKEFETFIPPRTLHAEIILFMALKITYSQLHRAYRTVWCLPPTFAVDAIAGSSSDALIGHYGKDWLTPYEHLNLIYLPIHENNEHWYLMVICMKDRKVYHLDSHLTNEAVVERTRTIKTLLEAMSHIVSTLMIMNDLSWGFPPLEDWDILEARGIPNCGTSDNSTIWVLEWMQMENSFVSTLYGILDEKAVRMKAALSLLLGNHNENKQNLIHEAEQNWEMYNPTEA